LAPNSYIVNGERVSADAYNKAKYEDLRERVPKGKKDTIKAHGDAQGESVNSFINRAIDQAIAQDLRKGLSEGRQSAFVGGVVSLHSERGEVKEVPQNGEEA